MVNAVLPILFIYTLFSVLIYPIINAKKAPIVPWEKKMKTGVSSTPVFIKRKPNLSRLNRNIR